MIEGDGRPDGITQLRALGQSVWLDDLGRHLLDTGSLGQLIREGVSGVTSNPTIFAEAFASAAYDDRIRSLGAEGLRPAEIAQALAIEDVGRAADLLLPVYEAAGGSDGFVSIEVAPRLAHDVDATVMEAHRLHAALARPNVMVKVPGTAAGVQALRRLIGDGVSVNVTLLFSPGRYEEILDAYVVGAEERIAQNRPVPGSVASFFLSRIDAAIDPMLDALGGSWSHALRGRAAIESARAAYQLQADREAGERWQRLAARGARTQRLLWASTGVKDTAYSPTRYVEALALPGTVTTLNRSTLADTLAMDRPNPLAGPSGLEELSGRLAELGIDMIAITRQLEAEGLAKFEASMTAMEDAVARRL
ncbi:MAG: transaldolase [Bauldia sp.]